MVLNLEQAAVPEMLVVHDIARRDHGGGRYAELGELVGDVVRIPSDAPLVDAHHTHQLAEGVPLLVVLDRDRDPPILTGTPVDVLADDAMALIPHSRQQGAGSVVLDDLL